MNRISEHPILGEPEKGQPVTFFLDGKMRKTWSPSMVGRCPA